MENRNEWLTKATKQLALLDEMSGIFFVPDARTLRAFLKKPTLIIKLIYGDIPDSYEEILNDYLTFKNKSEPYIVDNDDLKSLNKSYEKGLTPDEAAIEIIKWCDTPEEAGKIIASSSPTMLPFCLYLAMFFMAIFAITSFITNH